MKKKKKEFENEFKIHYLKIQKFRNKKFKSLEIQKIYYLKMQKFRKYIIKKKLEIQKIKNRII